MDELVVDIGFLFFFRAYLVIILLVLLILIGLLNGFFLLDCEIIFYACQSRISMFEKIGFKGFFPIDLNDINKDPHSHVELKPINQQRPLNVLLDNVALWRHVVVVHLHTDLKGRFA